MRFHTSRSIGIIRIALISGLLSLPALGVAQAAPNPGCEGLDAKGCVALSIQAMGGRQTLTGIANVRLDLIQNTLLTEQSYRQAPFITSYDRSVETIDFAKGRLLLKDHGIWPEADPGVVAAESDTTLVSTARATVVKTGAADAPGPLSQAYDTRVALELGPERLLLTAEAAPGLHFEPAEMLRATSHAVVAFTWNGRPMKVLLNRFNHLPDATETTRHFADFWAVWGDVDQRVYYDNWKVIGGVVYPTNRVEERNGIPWTSSQVLEAKFNTALDEQAFAMDPAAAEKSAQSKGRLFSDKNRVALAPGVDLYLSSWNTTVIKQDDGVLLLESPISPTFTGVALDKARSLYPGTPVKAVLSTSDSWPHVAGVREAVAQKLPVYILDLNQALLDRMMAAQHREAPDHLQTDPQRARWAIVSGKVKIGSGANRVELYPLRGAATDRQYMVYFPQHKLLYASDTLVADAKTQKIYDPELTLEVVHAVEREHLQVDTVYAMHQGPMPWADVIRELAATLKAAASA